MREFRSIPAVTTLRRATLGDFICNPQPPADVLEYFAGEERYLSLVVVSVIVKTIPADAVPGNALNLVHGAEGMFSRGLAMVAEEIVAGRDK